MQHTKIIIYTIYIVVVCLPGSYSMEGTGLEPCRQCAKDTYQEFSDQNDCVNCDDLFGTLGTGASHPDDCMSMCMLFTIEMIL